MIDLAAKSSRDRLGCNRSLASSIAVLLLALLPRAGRAAEGRWLDLSWRAPVECPAGTEIEKEITRLVGSSARVAGTLQAIVEVGADERGWRARVRTDYAGELGDRTIEGPTCRAVAKAAALLISLTIDSNAGKLDAVPPPVRRAPELPPPRRAVAESAPPPAPLRGFVAFGPRSEVGLLSNPAFGLELAIGALVPGGSLEIAGVAYLPEDTTVAGTTAGGRFTLLSVAGRLCPRIVRGTIEVFVCAVGSFDQVTAEGFGVTSPGSATTHLATVSIGPKMEFRLTPDLRLTGAVEAAYTPGRASFVIENIGEVHTAARIGGSARLQLVWYF